MATDDRLKRIEDKTDAIVSRLGSIDSTLAAQHVSLKEHMRRSVALEQQIAPLKEHVAMARGAIRLITLVAVLATLTQVLLALWGHK